MIYKLKSNYMLRGWRKYSWNLVERPYNYVQNLSQDEFQMLLLCDGETDFTESMLTESMQKLYGS